MTKRDDYENTEYEIGNAPVNPEYRTEVCGDCVAGTCQIHTGGRSWQGAGAPPERRRSAAGGVPTWAIVAIVAGVVLIMVCCVATTVAAVFTDPADPAGSSTAPMASDPSPTPSSSPSPRPTEEPEPDLDQGADVTVEASGTGLTLTNEGETHWRECEFELNGAGWGDGWRYDGFELYPADDEDLSEVTVAWGLMTDDDGARFDYATTAPEDLRLSCEAQEGGSGHASYEW